MFNIEMDPSESINLAGDQAYADKLAHLQAALIAAGNTGPMSTRSGFPEFGTDELLRQAKVSVDEVCIKSGAALPIDLEKDWIDDLNSLQPESPVAEKCSNALKISCPHDPLELPTAEICLKCSRQHASTQENCLPKERRLYCDEMFN